MRIVTGTPNQRGITLLELVIAIVVLSVGTLAVMRTLDQSRRQIGEASARLLALSVAQNRAEELGVIGMLRGRNLPMQVQQGPYLWSISQIGKKTEAGLYEVSITVSAPDLPGAMLVSYAPAKVLP